MTMITPSYLGETIEYSSLHACRSTLEDPTEQCDETYKHHGGGLERKMKAASDGRVTLVTLAKSRQFLLYIKRRSHRSVTELLDLNLF